VVHRIRNTPSKVIGHPTIVAHSVAIVPSSIQLVSLLLVKLVREEGVLQLVRALVLVVALEEMAMALEEMAMALEGVLQEAILEVGPKIVVEAFRQVEALMVHLKE
tara:strand:+ start:278 stop:595 length:318 start_codon:yes stop_codon:yes gene_type:complete